MKEIPRDADADDPVEEYSEVYEENMEDLRKAASCLRKMADATEEAYEQCDTVLEAAEYLEETFDERLTDEEREAIDDVA